MRHSHTWIALVAIILVLLALWMPAAAAAFGRTLAQAFAAAVALACAFGAVSAFRAALSADERPAWHAGLGVALVALAALAGSWGLGFWGYFAR